MRTKTTFIIIVSLSLVLMAAGSLVHAQTGGGKYATHWNAQGQADGYSSAFAAIYLMPLILLGTAILILFLPYLDPMRKNVAEFRPQINRFALIMAGFLAYLYLLTLAWNAGLSFSMNRLLVPAYAVLMYTAGALIGQAKRNYFVGIRTPWTLANDQVWDKTHRLGARLFKGAALVTLLGAVFPNQAVVFLIVPILFVTGYVMLYSYLEFRRIERGLSQDESKNG